MKCITHFLRKKTKVRGAIQVAPSLRPQIEAIKQTMLDQRNCGVDEGSYLFKAAYRELQFSGDLQ